MRSLLHIMSATIIIGLTIAPFVEAADIQMLHAPTGEQTSLSRLTTDDTGTVHLSWVQSQGKVSSLYRSSFADNAWSDASLISSGDDWFVNWADFPFLSVNDSSMAAHWLQKSSQGTYNYDVKATFYNGATQSWSPPATIHKDGVSAEHGFVSMLPLTGDRTLITWLDGRNTVKQENTESHAEGHSMDHTIDQTIDHTLNGMTLRAGIFNADGNTEKEWELDGLVCDCCQTSAAMTESGPVVVYRNRTEAEIRDIYITRKTDSGWSAPAPVHTDNWNIAGCPVNGPSIASRNGLTAVVWFTAKNDLPTVNMALSTDDGKRFGAPIVVAQDSTNGRVSMAILASGDIVVSWLETEGKAALLKLARYDGQGNLKEGLVVAETSASRRSGFPVMTSVGNDVYVTWTDLSDKVTKEVTKNVANNASSPVSLPISKGPRVKVAKVQF
ncbi:MAG: hypothetical protein ACI82A_000116 [Candidatus Azotimanducaceae bacterium]|jgi:hypothetical protein